VTEGGPVQSQGSSHFLKTPSDIFKTKGEVGGAIPSEGGIEPSDRIERSRDPHDNSLALLESASVAEPPRLYDPHALVIVPKTSDGYACTPDNLRRSVGCPRRTPIQPRLTTHTRINKEVTTTLQHLAQNFTSECGRI
jgi:hypothetical protein